MPASGRRVLRNVKPGVGIAEPIAQCRPPVPVGRVLEEGSIQQGAALGAFLVMILTRALGTPVHSREGAYDQLAREAKERWSEGRGGVAAASRWVRRVGIWNSNAQ